jgi:ATP-binding cassette subfamily B multidrug efflux pump
VTPVGRLFHYLGRHKTAFVIGGLCIVGSTIFGLVKPLIIGNAIDRIATARARADLLTLALLYLGATAVEAGFNFLQRWIIIVNTSWQIEYEMRNDLYAHLQTLPLRYYHHQRTGDLMSRVTNDLFSIRNLLGPALMYATSSLLVITGAFALMLRINTLLALVSLIAVPLVATLVTVFGHKTHERARAVQDQFGAVSARLHENLTGVRVVRAFGQERNEIETFKLLNRDYVERSRGLISLSASFYPLLNLTIGLMFVTVFYLGSRLVIEGSLSIAQFVAFQFFLARLVWPLVGIGWVINLFQRGMASMLRLHEIWAERPDAPLEGVRRVEEPPQGVLEIRHLTFSYDSQPVLRDVSLHVAPGQTVGIVGRTGSGKSTLLELITRTFEPPPGTIFIDGRPVESIPLRQLRQWIGMVPQETFLFSDTIVENIRFGKADASPAEAEEAAQAAGLSGDVALFPQGLETLIGERGITLSGGQKQRTAIARALVREPVILLLDDALSAVDTHTEEEILRSLRRIRKGRTVLVVSHRVSSVKDADQIIVLDGGAIIERGTHESLMAHRGYYADLYRRQTIAQELEEIA